MKPTRKYIRHGYSNNPPPEYFIYKAMLDRCYNSNHPKFIDYGGRGISVCDKWRESFDVFFKEMGRRPTNNHWLDRFPDKNGNYCPENCQWRLVKDQQNNKRNNITITYNGITKSQYDWTKELGRGTGWITYHLKKGKSLDWIMNQKKTDLVYIYIFKCNDSGLHKIGRTIDPKTRERKIRQKYPNIERVYLSDLINYKTESEIHKTFAEKQAHGEWFSLDDTDISEIKNIFFNIRAAIMRQPVDPFE